MLNKKISVIGSGAWGSALADLLGNNGYEVVIYGINEDEVNEINTKHTNTKYFNNGFSINDNVRATLSFEESVKDASIVLLAVPSFALVSTINKLNNIINDNVIIVNVAKGFDKETSKTFSYVINNAITNKTVKLVSLLGPSFAEEVAEHQLTAITASSEDLEAAKKVQEVFSSSYFRVYTISDVIGAEYCAALKNVIALASGILDGLGCKVNTRSALITRGIAEVSRYVLHFGGLEKTCLGLAGIGDLILTCSSKTSRNYSAGYTIGSKGVEYFKANNTKTVEGVYACEIAHRISLENNIYSPIINAVYEVLFENKDPKEKIFELMNNELKGE